MFKSKIQRLVRAAETDFDASELTKLRSEKRFRKLNPISQKILKVLEDSKSVKSYYFSKSHSGEDFFNYYTNDGSRFQDVTIHLSYWADIAKQFYNPYSGVPMEDQKLIAFNAYIENPTDVDLLTNIPWFKLYTDDVEDVLALIG